MSRPENPVIKLNEAYHEFAAGKISRRQLMARASGLGLSAAAVSVFMRGVPATAQEASPVAVGAPIMSITAAEYSAKLMEWWTTYEAPATTGGTLIQGDSSGIATFNLMLGSDSPTNPVMNLVQEMLVGSSPIDGQYVPALADHWEIAADGLSYTFFLRQGVLWHDGTPFTADDVIFSFEAQANPLTGSSYTSSFTGAVAGWEKIDDLTVKVSAVDVFPEIVFHGNAYCPIVPKHIWEGVAAEAWAADSGSNGSDPSRVIGTGPFRFQGLDEGAGTVTFARNENYYDQVPSVDNWIFSVWPDQISATEALRAGDIDFQENVLAEDVAGLQAPDQGTDVLLYETYSFRMFAYNLDPARTTLFQDVNVRRALFHALDRASMVENLMLGYAVVANGTQPTLSIAYAPDRIDRVYNFDPAMASTLLADAGWADTDGDGILEKDGQKFSFAVMLPSGRQDYESMIAYMQEAWKSIGIEMTPQPVDFGTVLVPALTETFDFEVVAVGFNWDPTADQSAMFHTDAHGGGGFNAMKYSNPEADVLMDAANREVDFEARRELLIQTSNIVNDDLPVGILWFSKDRTAYRTRVRNFNPNANGTVVWSLPWVWIQE